MAQHLSLSALAKLLLPLLLLSFLLLAANAAKPRRHRKRQANGTPSPPPASANCQDPPEAELKRRLGEELSHPYALHQSFYQHDGLRGGVGEDTLDSFEAGKKGPVHIRRAPLDSASHRHNCTPVERRTPEGVVNDPCPITWVLNVDINRVPRVLVEGQCNVNCTACASMGKQQDPGKAPEIGSPMNNADRTSCQTVNYYTRVLRKTYGCDLKKKFLYASVWERITVGCACRGQPSRSTPQDNDRAHSARSSQH